MMIFQRNIVIAFIAVFVFAPLAWMAMDRDPPYEFIRVEISPDDPRAGDKIYITFTVKQSRASCSPGLVYREFKEASGKLHIFDPIVRAREPNIVDNKFTRIATLPDNISSGPVMYQGKACYTCNPIHSWLRWPVCVETPSVSFNVREKEVVRMRQ